MASRNDITGDKIQTKGILSKEGEDRFDAIFRKKEVVAKEPIGAWASIRWDDGAEGNGYYFSFGDGLEETVDPDNGDIIADHWGVPDEKIFYFVSSEEELKSFMTEGVEEFVVLEYEVVYKEIKNDNDE